MQNIFNNNTVVAEPESRPNVQNQDQQDKQANQEKEEKKEEVQEKN